MRCVVLYAFCFCLSFCGFCQARETEIYYLADFESNVKKFDIPEDYFLGKFVYNKKNGHMFFVPVETDEDVSLHSIVLKFQHRKEPRLFLKQEAAKIGKLIHFYEYYGLNDYVDGKVKNLKPGMSGFENALAYHLSTHYALVNQVAGLKYFSEGMSKSLGQELRLARLYYHPLYPHAELSRQEYERVLRFFNLSVPRD